MKKKIALFAGLALLVVIAVAGISIYKYNELLKVKSFSISDYEEYIEEYNEYKEYYKENDPAFYAERYIEFRQIPDAETLRAVAGDWWLEIYGEEEMKDEKPYLVYYDEANDVWYIRGCHEKPSFLLKGGVAHIIVQSDGKVLAEWRDRD